MLPEDKQEFASQLRRRQLQRQLPLHDLDPRFCSSLNEKETAKYEKFIEKRRKKAAGIGQIGEVSSSGSLVRSLNLIVSALGKKTTIQNGGTAKLYEHIILHA